MLASGTLGCPACAPLRPARAQPQKALRCQARRSAEEPEQRLEGVKLALSGLAAAVLLQSAFCPSAEAGVVIEKSGGRKLYQGGTAKPKPIPADAGKPASSGGGFSLPSVSLPSLPGLPGLPSVSLPGAPSLPSVPQVSLSPDSGAFDPLTVVLPVVVAGIGGVGFLASKLDIGFAEFFREAIVKDSGGFAGYEETLKGPKEALSLPIELPSIPNPFGGGEEPSNGKSRKTGKRGGTQALKGKKGGKGGSSSSNPLAGLFGKK